MQNSAGNEKKTPNSPIKSVKKRAALLLIVAVLVLASVATLSSAVGRSSILVVPDDYSTIIEAIDAATDGDTILVRKGIYDVPQNQTLTITKTLSLIGEDADYTLLKLHPLYHEVFILGQSCGWTWADSAKISADAVVISGFTIVSDGGAFLANGNGTKLMGNIVMANVNLNGSSQIFAYNLLTPATYPNGTLNMYSRGMVECSGTYNQVAANTLENGVIAAMGRYGTVFANFGTGSICAGGTSDSNVIYNNTLTDGDGIWGASTHLTIACNTVINSSSDGVAIRWGYYNSVYCNVITDCLGVGLLEIDNAGANTFYANQVANNSWGAKIAAWSSNTYHTTLYNNNFVGNSQQVNTDKTETFSSAGLNFTRQINHGGYFDNGTVGNYWSTYNGTDNNSDSIGDTPYVIDDNRSDHYPLMNPFDITLVKVQLPAWANATLPTPIQMPAFQPQPTPSPSIPSTPLSSSESTATATDSPIPSSSIPELQPWIIPALLTTVLACFVFVNLRKNANWNQANR
ncbi:MAG: hypothetical protein NWF05_09935 [Candidatus Bathyarchaeota archaeon]|nr:hypothetical protein [Candidatus Bathyarchaeota archaeon]